MIDSSALREATRLRIFLAAALLAAILYICCLSGLNALGLVGPDEPRYAAIARDMAATGDWVTPRLFGQPWFEKPALYYWSAALAYRAGFTDETAARLPAAFFALFTTVGIAWLARRFYGRLAALMVLLMLPTCVAMIGFSHAATTDMPFAACLALSMVAAAQMVLPPERASQASPVRDQEGQQSVPKFLQQTAWACAWGFFLGLATLSKGPAAVVLAAGSVALWVLTTRRWRDALGLLHPAGIVCFCATALPWYVLCALRNPRFLRIFLLEHNLQRFATNRYQHAQPFWFFAPILLLAVFPWTTLLVVCARDALQANREKRLASSSSVFFACWAIFPFLFFSASQSKLPGYILPAVPPLILLIARSASRALDEKGEALRWCMAAVGASFALFAIAAGLWIARPEERGGFGEGEYAGLMATAGLALIALLITALALSRKQVAAVVTAALFVAFLVSMSTALLVPRLDARISPRATARAVLRDCGREAALATYDLPRAWKYGLDFYARREIPEWTPEGRYACIVANTSGTAELKRLGVNPLAETRISPEATILRLE